MNYSNLTKAQLIEHINKLEKQTLQAKLEVVNKEIRYAVEDLTKLARWLYESGVQSRKAVQSSDLYKVVAVFVREQLGGSSVIPG